MAKKKPPMKEKDFPNWLIQLLKKIRWQRWAIYCVVLFVVGTLINVQSGFSFKFFVPHQILLIAATTMLVYAMKSFFNDMELFQSNSKIKLLDKNPEISSLYNKRLMPLQRNTWPFLIAIIVTGFFFTCIVMLEYVSINAVGIYAIYIAGSSVLLGVYSYVQYLYFLWFIYKAGKCKYQEYDRYAPASTSWVVQMAKTSQRLRNYFLFIGLIYVIEYSMLVPTDKIVITDTSISIQMPNNIAFIVSWIALFFLVILAFPIINYVQYKLVSKLVSQLKDKSISDISSLMLAERDLSKDKKARLNTVMTYSVLIENIRQSKNYPISRQLSYEALMTLGTFFVHAMNLYTKIASVPQLNSLLPQF